jgi:hypothetical protein
VTFSLGSVVKCTSSYLLGANWDPCCCAHPSAFRWMRFRVLQFFAADGPIARIDASSM